MREFLKKPYSRTVVFAVVFLIYTLAVTLIDRRPIAPDRSSVGFGALNDWFFKTFKTSPFFEVLSKLIGVVCILIVVLWLAVFVLRLVNRKSLKKIEKYLYVFLAFIVVLSFLYVFFNVVSVNVRPVLEDGKTEPSYPSSHTLLIMCVTFVSAITLPRLIKDKTVLKTACPVLKAVGIIGVFCRLLSGVHWLTDIIGGVLLSLTLISLYRFALKAVYKKKKPEDAVR